MKNVVIRKLSIIVRALRRLFRNPDHVAMRLLGRFDILRPVVARLLRREPVGEDAQSPDDSLFRDLDTEAVLRGLRRDGLYVGLQLPDFIRQEILDYVQSALCFGERNPQNGFYRLDGNPHAFRTAQYFNAAAGCSAVARLQNDPLLRAIAREYLDSEPVLQGVNLWWSLAVKGSREQLSQAAQMYHFDIDDFRFVKFFFYLSDVDDVHGPHVCVRGTHRRKLFRHQFIMKRREDRDVEDAYGRDRVETICGPAGFGFAEDTLCFHKGTPPVGGDRLVLQIEFGLRDYDLQHDRMPASQLRRRQDAVSRT